MSTIQRLFAGIVVVLSIGVALGAGEAEKPPTAGKKILLDDVVVTATRGERSVRNLGGVASVVEAEPYAGAGLGIESLLANEELLYIHGGTYPGEETSIVMRGIQGRYLTQRVLVMIDGRPLNDEYQGAADLRTIALEGIERVEVVRGPGSALYGTDAIAGVINVIRKFGVKGTALRASFGEDQTSSVSLTHGDPRGNDRYQLTGTTVSTNGFLLNTDGSHRDWDMADSHVQLGWRLGGFSELSVAAGCQEHSGTQDMFQDTQTLDYQDLKWATDSGWEVRAFRNGLQRKLEWIFGFDAEYRQHTETGRITKTHQFGPHRLTLGVETEQQAVDIEEASGNVDDNTSTFSAFAQGEVALPRNLMLTLGARYDEKQDFDPEVSPRIGLLYKPVENTDIYLSAAKAFRAPSFADTHLPLTFFNGMFFEGAPGIDPETVWTYEIGLRHVFTEKIAGRLSVYYSHMRDTWDYMFTPAPGYVLAIDPAALYFTPQNVTEQTALGAELGLTFRPAPRVVGSFQIQLTEPEYEKYAPDPTIEGNTVEETPRFAASTAWTYRTSFGASVQGVIRHTGNRYTDAQNTSAGKLDEYTVMDIHLSSPVAGGTSTFLSITNAWNERYKHFTTHKEPRRRFYWGVVLRY